MTTNHPTAILLFSRTAEAEAQAKSFGAGAVGDVRIATELIRCTERMLNRAGLPVIRADESRQRGRDFGTRLATAMTEAFALGYENLLVVGNDAPDLTVGHLQRASQSLAAGVNVVVPDRRGGIALLGICREDFAPAALTSLAWETDALREELLQIIPNAQLMSAVRDINALADLRLEWSRLRSRLGRLAHLLVENILVFAGRSATPARLLLSTVVRGPPVWR
ncbi:DUF2064 domain-containing protein [Neolewinella antarctica]|uniref:2-phospho-L-lactate guanylyltransferase (CobY/MobA/RfbA family) n=1 Tax=Neolewinella antarctica TaxID=442734 RepID=A0ABX0XAS3_9BACT|nr:DUF2064 domain-containing protein [Neolewinella antarctica]NJC26371.1 2-phospho-L-lactate guanylyltransferase (CobY/MobA/RfbA family) [Neolewinella antarctica]